MFEADATSLWWGLSPMMLLVGGVCHVVGMAFPHWMATSEAHAGLWVHCTVKSGVCVGITEKLNDLGKSAVGLFHGV